MTAFWRWYASVQVLGLLALPIAFSVLRRLPDRGCLFAKTLGVLLHGLVLWLGVACGLLRNDAGGAVLAAAALLGFATVFGREALHPPPGSPSLARWLRSNAWLILMGEFLFLVFFAGWALVRAHDPAADHTERPMDLMFLTAVHSGTDYPPRDPWLAGYPVSYYYLGHWMLSALGRLSGTTPAVAYNLGQACWLALLVAGCLGLGFDLVAIDPTARRRRALATGLLTATAVALAGNPQGALDALQRAGYRFESLEQGRAAYNFSPPGEPWWWWRASRVLEDRGASGQHLEVIDEFPAFSFVVGDAHPHLLALPFLTLALALALQLHVAARGGGLGQREGRRCWALSVVVLGALPALNAWDFPTQWLVSLLAVGLALWHGPAGPALSRKLAPTAGFGIALGAGAVLLSLPYLITAQGQVAGLGLNHEHRTPLFQLLLMLGPLLGGSVVALPRPIGRTAVRVAVAAGLAVVAGILALSGGSGRALLSELPWTAALLAALLGATASALVARDEEPGARRFVLLLVAVGLLLLLIPEIAYVRDGFGTRMNTVFKLYYQAWLLLGVAAAFGISSAWTAGSGARVASRATLLLVLAGLPYTVAAALSVTEPSRTRVPTLDALASLSTDESAALAWVRRHTPPRAVVLQAKGRSYAPDECRLSAGTGRATLLGWEGHELQWRGRAYETMAAGRAEALETVYRLAGAEKLAFTLQTWGIEYVFVGPVERRVYGVDAAREELFERVMERVFAAGDVRIYRRRDG